MLETMIIVVVLGILSIIAAPNLSSLLDSIKVDQAVTELRSSLSETQRQAIRGGQTCMTSVLVQETDGSGKIPEFQSVLNNQCLNAAVQHVDLPKGISIVTNIVPEANNTGGTSGGDTSGEEQSGWCKWMPWLWFCDNPASNGDTVKEALVGVGFGKQGSANYGVQTSQSTIQDPTGKFVVFVSKKPTGKQKCVAVSPRLGLTRIGTYIGGLLPNEITDEGICEPKNWQKQ